MAAKTSVDTWIVRFIEASIYDFSIIANSAIFCLEDFLQLADPFVRDMLAFVGIPPQETLSCRRGKNCRS